MLHGFPILVGSSRSATASRSSWLIDQRPSARSDRKALEKTKQGGPAMGSSSPIARLQSPLDKTSGQRQSQKRVVVGGLSDGRVWDWKKRHLWRAHPAPPSDERRGTGTCHGGKPSFAIGRPDAARTGSRPTKSRVLYAHGQGVAQGYGRALKTSFEAGWVRAGQFPDSKMARDNPRGPLRRSG
jgi:hypothetical protein